MTIREAVEKSGKLSGAVDYELIPDKDPNKQQS